MMLSVRKPFQVLLLCFAVLSLYYVTIFSEFCLLDDCDMINGLINIDHIDWKSIFFPNAVKGGYYRPLIETLYMVDRFVWGLESRIMHFENIVFHLVNVILFFLVASEFMKNDREKQGYLPLFVALLFAVHPIATESVNWISGRTDLLAGIFLLFATFILIRYLGKRPWWLWPVIGICVLFGMAAKETVVAFVFVVFLLLRMKNYDCDYKSGVEKHPWNGIALLTAGFYAAAVITALFLYNYLLVMLIVAGYGVALYWWEIGTPRRDYMRLWLGIGVCLVLAASLFFLVRKFVFVSDIARIPQTLTLIKADPAYTIKIFTGAIGFYMKKFLFPFPLNLAIREIDPLYELVGIGLLLLTVLFVRIGGVVSSLALSGLCLVTPALPLSLGTVAWTAYAERYIYLALPFWLLAVALSWRRVAAFRVGIQRMGAVIAGIVLIVLAAGTFKRNLTWQTNLGIFKDTVANSPNFKVTRGLYMLALYENDRYDEALDQYRIASSLPSLEYDEKFDLLYASIMIKQGHPDEARSVFEKILHKKETVGVLENFRSLLISMRTDVALHDPRRQDIDRMVLHIYERLYLKSGDALYIYRLGQEHLNNAKRSEAQICFAKAARELPESSDFKKYARNLAIKLQ